MDVQRLPCGWLSEWMDLIRKDLQFERNASTLYYQCPMQVRMRLALSWPLSDESNQAMTILNGLGPTEGTSIANSRASWQHLTS